MTGQTPSQMKNLRKKLQKREQRILGRLQEAQKAQARALERFHRDEARLQKRISSVQRIEGRLTLVRQQLDELNTSPTVPTVETGIPAWAQSNAPSDKAESITEPTDLATEARAAAEAAEQNTRLATARAAEISETARIEAVENTPLSPLEEAAGVAEIEAEEEIVEAISAVTIAEITAERAAAAEALAQASSAHTREARRRAQLAEQALGEIRVAIRSGLLTGEEAEHALQEAEREVTHAQAYLADAEAAEEQALTAAMNAEAEAEVAEGMAYAAVNRTGPLPEEEQTQGDREEATGEVFQSYPSQEVVDDEPDITLKIPRVGTQETE
ncbi:MAG TPA: hypothetical protein VF844_08385 [Ktedonobacteraceae bacterium]